MSKLISWLFQYFWLNVSWLFWEDDKKPYSEIDKAYNLMCKSIGLDGVGFAIYKYRYGHIYYNIFWLTAFYWGQSCFSILGPDLADDSDLTSDYTWWSFNYDLRHWILFNILKDLFIAQTATINVDECTNSFEIHTIQSLCLMYHVMWYSYRIGNHYKKKVREEIVPGSSK